MRITLAALLAALVCACGSAGGGGALRELGPVFAEPARFNGRTFEGEVYIVADRADPSLYRLSQTEDGAQWFALQNGAQQRLQDWYHLNPGHRILARGLLRPTPCGERNACAEGEARFTIMNLQILRRPGQ